MGGCFSFCCPSSNLSFEKQEELTQTLKQERSFSRFDLIHSLRNNRNIVTIISKHLNNIYPVVNIIVNYIGQKFFCLDDIDVYGYFLDQNIATINDVWMIQAFAWNSNEQTKEKFLKLLDYVHGKTDGNLFRIIPYDSLWPNEFGKNTRDLDILHHYTKLQGTKFIDLIPKRFSEHSPCCPNCSGSLQHTIFREKRSMFNNDDYLEDGIRVWHKMYCSRCHYGHDKIKEDYIPTDQQDWNLLGTRQN